MGQILKENLKSLIVESAINDLYENGVSLADKYVPKRDGSHFYNYIKTFTMYSSNAGTFKITLPTPEAGTTAAWYMMSFEVIWQRPYNDINVFATNKMLFNYC